MMGSASYAAQSPVRTGCTGRFPEAVNNQNVVLLECSTLTPPLSSLILGGGGGGGASGRTQFK